MHYDITPYPTGLIGYQFTIVAMTLNDIRDVVMWQLTIMRYNLL
jgi:hypothetical protein